MVRWTNLGESLAQYLIEAEKSSAAKQAESQNLIHVAYGNYSKEKGGPIVAKTVNGKLVPVKGSPDVSRRGAGEQPSAKKTAKKSTVSTSKGPPPTEEKPKAPRRAPKKRATATKSKFSNSSEATTGLVSGTTTIERGGQTINVRNMIDEKGNAIDVSMDRGRKRAIRLINMREKQLQPKILDAVGAALSSPPKGPEGKAEKRDKLLAKKWLGEIGELLAIRDLLEEGAESYFLPASAAKNDLVILSPTRKDSRDLKMSYVSVKSTKAGGEANGLGANASSDFKAILGGKTMTVGGQQVNAFEYAESAMKLKRAMLKFFSQGLVGSSGVSTEGINPKLLQMEPEKINHPTSKIGFTSQVAFLRARIVNGQELGRFLTDYTSELEATGPIGIALVKDLQEKVTEKRPPGAQKFSLKDLDDWLFEQMGKTLDETNSIAVQSADTMTARYAEGEGFQGVKIALGEDVTKKTLEHAIERGLSVDKSGRPTSGVEQVKMLWGLSQRTRGLGNKASGTAHLDGILNNTPMVKVQSIELDLPDYIDRIGYRRRTLDVPLG